MTTYMEFITLYNYLNVVLYIDIGIMIVYNKNILFFMEFVMAEKRISFNAFTLSEVLLAVVIVGIIAGMVLPVLTTNFYTYLYNNAYDRDVNKIEEAVEGLNIAENQKTFFDTMMYVDAKPDSYAETSGKFLKKYLRIAKYCGDSNGDCFAKSYSAYTINKKKEDYTPTFDGACASLKNGASICITPQIGSTGIHGFIDLNGAKGPNILSKDLRQFFIDPKHRTVFDKETSDVIALDEDPIRPDVPTVPEPETPKDPEPPEVTLPDKPLVPNKNLSSVKVTCEKRGAYVCNVDIVNAKFTISTLTTIPGSKPPIAVGPGDLVYNPGLGGNYEKPSYGVDGIGSKPGEKHNTSTYDKSSLFTILLSQEIGVCQVIDGNNKVRYSTSGDKCLSVHKIFLD